MNDKAKPADRYRVLFENSADAILIIEDGKFVDCNSAVVEMLRYNDKDTLLQTHPSELSPRFQPDGQASYDKANKLMAIAIERGSHRFEWDHVKADGEVFPVEVSLTAIPAERGYDLHTVWRDISERRQLENELRHAHKMEAIGKLAGGIAHDFNNQLVPILGYAELMKEAVRDNPKLLNWAREIHRAGSVASALVNKLLAFSRKDVQQQVTLDLNEMVGNLLGMLGKLIGEDIKLKYAGAERELWVKSDPGDIEQIVLNLASNARDALPAGGEIDLSVSTVRRSNLEFARIEVTDRGVGMDPETLSQMYVPFFTTKGLGRGTGLGMSTVYGLVTKSNGEISAQSKPGEGTTIEVLLPSIPSPRLNIQEPDADASVALGGTLLNRDVHVLVVEDESQVARLTRQVLLKEGFRVSEASNGSEALEVLERESADLILTDVIMSEMSGPSMVKKMEDRGITIPVIFMSGYTDERLLAHGFDIDHVALVRKPFSPAKLVRRICEVISSSE